MENVEKINEVVEKINQMPITQEEKDYLIEVLVVANSNDNVKSSILTLQDLRQFLLTKGKIYEPSYETLLYNGDEKQAVVSPKCYDVRLEDFTYGVFNIDKNLFTPAKEVYTSKFKLIGYKNYCSYRYLEDLLTGNRISKKEEKLDNIIASWDRINGFKTEAGTCFTASLKDVLPQEAINKVGKNESEISFVTLRTLQNFTDWTNVYLDDNPNFIEDVFVKRKQNK